MTLEVLVINRARDTQRFQDFKANAERCGIAFRRIDALDAHRPHFPFAAHAALIRDHFWGGPDIKPGAIGCFLSHRLAWQALLDSQASHALVLEDDCDLDVAPEDLAKLPQQTDDHDLVFANNRMAAWARAVRPDASDPVDLNTVIAGLAVMGGPDQIDGLTAAPGADAYLITRVGAQKLLTLADKMGIICGVDWAMLWGALSGGSLTDTAQNALPELGILAQHAAAPELPLSATVLTTPVGTQRKGVPSALRHRRSLPIVALGDRPSVLCHTEYVSTLNLSGTRVCFAGRAGNDPVMAAHRAGLLWDADGLIALLAHFPAGGTFVDIGAHLGNHCVIMGCLGAAGRLIPVEPNDEILRLLQTNLAINGLLDRSDPVPPGLALGREDADGWLIRNRRKSSETMVKLENPDVEQAAVAVRIRTGDGLLADTRVDAIKIDTSGTEVDVLRGLSGVIARQSPLLLVDHSAEQHDRLARIADRLGYRSAGRFATLRKGRDSTLLVPVRTDGGR